MKITVTKEGFKRLTGREPVDDDLERTNCRNAGERGHRQCGFCTEHMKPRFMCGCLLFNKGGNK